MMWKREIILGFLGLLASPSMAAEKTVGDGNPFENKGDKQSAPDRDGRTLVKVTAEDCARLLQHTPRADVAYKPGVDVDGDKVTPADLANPYSAIQPPAKVEFDIAFNPLHAAIAHRFGETKLSLGRVAYDINTGEMAFNGKPLSKGDKSQLAAGCRQRLKRSK